MSTIQVKPAPGLAIAAHAVLKHPVSGGLLDAADNVPEGGRPWLDDGFTARMLTDGAIVRVEREPEPAAPDVEPDPAR